jgi:hypothetical protein
VPVDWSGGGIVNRGWQYLWTPVGRVLDEMPAPLPGEPTGEDILEALERGTLRSLGLLNGYESALLTAYAEVE